MKMPELLVPASSLEVLKTAVVFGADAVYIGGEAFGLRAMAKNFSKEEMAEGIAFAHERNVKVYVTANILAHNYDLEGVEKYFNELKEIKPDALIISDPGVFSIAKRVCPEIDVHISTQANNTNYGTFNFWHSLGARRVVSARELSLEELKEIRANIPDDLEIETFIHGAMCISYSGRCLLSNFLTGRDANRGACTHPCRWKYSIMEETRPGEYFPVYENERGTYIFNSKDLCMIEHIPELVDAGIDSLKIEGRMKTALYVATVARTYRKALDDYKESKEKYLSNMDWYKEQIASCTYRQFTTGFFFGKPDETAQIYDNNTYIKGYTYLGIVEPALDGLISITQKNKFSVGEEIEIMKPDGENLLAKVIGIYNDEDEMMESAPHPQQHLRVRLSEIANKYDILRRRELEDGH
ncbi:putative protease [Acetitomaculum ruminis DSM 5522]|uniref:Putative protease n=1 Tax=Acetitomaculum ruminis DSM 5522 TaxID=1120918 RepID=A0A1I0ZJZ6_9FIRM|nr:U32 family peptidase [Acetitomaculum ruminis]SFB24850.1 putative protease [Acetitomaculum ruminis DSM 5522]